MARAGRRRRAAQALDDVGTADFSRDGTKIAFTRNANGLARTDLWIADADGSNARELAKTDIGAAGRDTSSTRRELGGFDAERATESFGIAPDGRTLTVGVGAVVQSFSIEGLPLKKES